MQNPCVQIAAWAVSTQHERRHFCFTQSMWSTVKIFVFIVTAGQIDSWIFDFNSQSTTEQLPGRDKRPATMTINIINGIPLFVLFFIFLDRFSFFLSCCIFHYPVRNQIDASTFDRFICRLLSRIAQAISRVVEVYTAPSPRHQ